MKDFDLRTAGTPEVIGYLRRRGLDVPVGAEVVTLTGGVSGSVVRVDTADGPVVCKQALAQLAVPGRWEADRRRTLTEGRAMEVLGAITPAAVPRMLDMDPDTLTLTMACAPDGWDCWKDRLLAAEEPPRSADIARTLGECLSVWHRSTADSSILEDFDDHETFRLLRTDPFYRSLGDVHPEIAERVNELAKDLHERRSCLVHGDFSPKNVLSGTDGLWVVDHEVAVAAHPVFDLAFLMSHLVLKAVAPERRHLLEAAAAFLDAYRAGWPDCEVPDEEIAAHVAVLMLARVDGVSQVHYLSSEQRDQVRQLSVRQLTGEAPGLKDLFDEVRAFGRPEEMCQR